MQKTDGLNDGLKLTPCTKISIIQDYFTKIRLKLGLTCWDVAADEGLLVLEKT
jgi:hypothetical protein